MPDFTKQITYQHNYEAALGRMLVRFNELESVVTEILRVILTEKLAKPHLFQVNDYYRQKVDRLELAMYAFPNWPQPDFGRLRRINGWRNDLAHGHFHQDPNTGGWQTEGVHKRGHKAVVIKPEIIDDWTRQVRQAYGDVGRLLPYVWFDEPDDDAPLPPGATRIPPISNNA